MEVISLGGVGGCQIAGILRNLNYPAYPYDWLICNQSFVINSFCDITNFFNFEDNSYIYESTKFLDPTLGAIMLHDFNNYILEKRDIINKYNRRFQRLYSKLENTDPILFIRSIDNLNINLTPINYYDNIYIREEESINKWNLFLNMLINKYNKKLYLLLITSDPTLTINNNLNKNIYLSHCTTDIDITTAIANLYNKLNTNI